MRRPLPVRLRSSGAAGLVATDLLARVFVSASGLALFSTARSLSRVLHFGSLAYPLLSLQEAAPKKKKGTARCALLPTGVGVKHRALRRPCKAVVPYSAFSDTEVKTGSTFAARPSFLRAQNFSSSSRSFKGITFSGEIAFRTTGLAGALVTVLCAVTSAL
jgi:hypothetical protein